MTAPALAFDTDNGRYYRHPGNSKTVPSITNIKSKKHVELKHWAARKCADYAADRREVLATLERQEAYDLVKGALYAREENSPAEIGDQVHKWVEHFVKGGNAPEVDCEDWGTATSTARGMWKQFRHFHDTAQPEYTLSEFTVWSDTHDYAGTGDLGLKYKGRHILVDTKTGKAVYPDVAMQLAALAFADYIVGENGDQQEIPKFDAYGILHLRPRSATLVPVFHIDDWFRAFLGLRELFRTDVEFSNTTLGSGARFQA
jgi:hypothetical protein